MQSAHASQSARQLKRSLCPDGRTSTKLAEAIKIEGHSPETLWAKWDVLRLLVLSPAPYCNVAIDRPPTVKTQK
jgi:hypothetical protein